MMKAAILQENEEVLIVQNTDLPSHQTEEIVVIHAAALNHRDVWIMEGKYPGIRYPIILGSDGTGICDGKPVLLQPGLSWGTQQAFQENDYEILGLPRNGTFAQMISIPQTNVFEKPEHLSWYGAAALPLAGLTAYRALFSRAQVTMKDKVLITGIGGGVALFALQFAIAIGAEVFVTSSSNEKIQKALAMGASYGFNYKEENWTKEMRKATGGIDVIIDGAGGPDFGNMLKGCNPGARVVVYGGTAGKIQLSPQIIFWKQINFLGSTMGSPMDFQNMLNFVSKFRIQPVIDSVFPLSEINQAIERMKTGQQFGKIVINMQNA